MKIKYDEYYLGITDKKWYSFLKEEYGIGLIGEKVNFWTNRTERVKKFEEGELFLFKLHNIKDSDEKGQIVGCGNFDYYEKMTISEAWEKFGRRNGAESLDSLKESLKKHKYKNKKKYKKEENLEESTEIGCIILKNVIFFDEDKWRKEPDDWSKYAQPGKTYSNETEIGDELLKEMYDRIILYTNA